jgi:hypothetical protein
MMQHYYEIDGSIMKTNENMTLWKADLGFVEVEKDSLAASVRLGDEVKGYVFHGKAKLALDTILETGNGAVGKTTEKDLTEPFLMLGDAEQIQSHLTAATAEDLRSKNHKDSKEFIEHVEDVFHRFLRKQMHTRCWDHPDGFVFAFANPEGRPDLLVADHDRIVYKSRSLTYVSNSPGVIMKGSEHGLAMRHGHCCIIRESH